MLNSNHIATKKIPEFKIKESGAVCHVHCISIDNFKEVKDNALHILKSLGVREGVSLRKTDYEDYALLSFTGLREEVYGEEIYVEKAACF